MSAFTQIDLSTLPAPDVIEELSFETIFAAMLADLQARDPVFDALLESDPAYKILEVAAYRELLLRQRVNDAARAVMLAYATGADLDQLGALLGVLRLVIDEGDAEAVPPVPQVLESDTEFRRRIQLSLEGFSVAGPRGAYIFHGLSADANVLDISATSPDPGEVLITVLSRVGNGAASGPLLAAVNAALNDDAVRPLTDQVTVQSASIVNYNVHAHLYVYPGPDVGSAHQGTGRARCLYRSSPQDRTGRHTLWHLRSLAPAGRSACQPHSTNCQRRDLRDTSEPLHRH